MEAKELRIGNFVDFGIVSEIVEITTNHVRLKYFRKDVEKQHISVVHFDDRVKPILLTEEWLLKFGFVESSLSEDNKWLNLKYRFLNFSSDESVNFKKVYLCINKMDIICDYVHQLQNLYFALTGEELTIKNQE